jgi:predicted ribosomally synthesized peptide with nif11-like leader
MSISEAERFANDLAKNKELLAEVKPEATGLASIVAIGKQHGYDFSLDEAKQFIQSRSPRELTDTQLDAIAGGKQHKGGSSTSSNVAVNSNIAVATNTVEAAETITTAATTAEVVANGAVASEAVCVAVVV